MSPDKRVPKNLSANIKILKNGPYLVSGEVPLVEKIITPQGKGYIYEAGDAYPLKERYSLCRCGESKNHPYCDGEHSKCDFNGEETADPRPFRERAEKLSGKIFDLYDDYRCALARFCHRDSGDAWELALGCKEDDLREEAIKAVTECPAGRLELEDKNGNLLEPVLEPGIDVLQDSEKYVSGPLYVKGKISLQSSSGEFYESRNRYTLCRCGHSKSKPFCDGRHIKAGFKDS